MVIQIITTVNNCSLDHKKGLSQIFFMDIYSKCYPWKTRSSSDADRHKPTRHIKKIWRSTTLLPINVP